VIDNPEIMRLLVVSREMAALRPVWSLAESHGWHLDTASTAWEAMERVQSGILPHLLILDLSRGDHDNLHVLRWLRRLRPELSILLLCHQSDADRKEDAIRLGADEVLIRPFADELLEHVMSRYLRGAKGEVHPAVTSEHIERLGEDCYFVSVSSLMRKVRAQSELLAQVDVPVLILGERGSGKETTARLIHSKSVRSGFRFFKVNCTAVPGDLLEKELFGSGNRSLSTSSQTAPGEIEIPKQGVLFLHEITALPARLQMRLFELLEARHSRDHSPHGADVRILASTSENIEHALAEKRLREDLYYRLSAFTVHIPPLRQRKEEIRMLLRHFMNLLAKHYGLPPREFSEPIVEACQNYSWPGNLGELETFVKRYLISGHENVRLGVDDDHPGADSLDFVGLQPSGSSSQSTDEATMDQRSLKVLIRDVKSETERNAIGVALEKTGWNRKAAARLLKVSYRTLLYKIEQYHMNVNESFVTSLPGLSSSANSGSKGKAS